MSHTDPAALRALLGPRVSLRHRSLTGEHGVALPPLIDHHVHLHLIDPTGLAAHGIAGVVDLGGDPAALVRLPRDGMPRAVYAGAFLTAPGGYPSGRSWAPRATVREVTDASGSPGVPGGARTAVDEQAEFGASVIKLALNEDAGAVFDDATLSSLIAAAHRRGLPVVAHVEGGDTARRAIDAGVDALAHTPFTTLLVPDLVHRAAAAGQAWISTLAIHGARSTERDIAMANLRAFAGAGGRVLYGTDLGNGDLPVGVNVGELAALRGAGLGADAIIAALADPWPGISPIDDDDPGIATFVPGPAPRTEDDVPAWLARATVVPSEELIHDEEPIHDER